MKGLFWKLAPLCHCWAEGSVISKQSNQAHPPPGPQSCPLSASGGSPPLSDQTRDSSPAPSCPLQYRGSAWVSSHGRRGCPRMAAGAPAQPEPHPPLLGFQTVTCQPHLFPPQPAEPVWSSRLVLGFGRRWVTREAFDRLPLVR